MLLPRLALVAVTLGSSGVAPGTAHAQSPDLVYISNVSVSEFGGEALPTIREQTRATLDRLGEELSAHGLDYRDVVVSNVFLKDTRLFAGMNEVYRTYFDTDPPTRATVQADLLDPAALVQLSVVAARGTKEVVRPSGMQSPELPYSWGYRVGNILFVAGATSRDPDTYQPVTGDVATQTRRVFGNIGLVLEEAGLSPAELVSCKVFIDDTRAYGAMNQAYAASVPSDDPPARATVRAGLMNPVFSTEIQCIAVEAEERAVVIAEGRARGSLPFSPGIDTGDRVYLSGMIGQGTGVEEKTEATLETMGQTLAAAGLDFGDVEDVWVYLSDIRNWEDVAAVLSARLPAGTPTPTVVGTPLVGDFDVEIQMVARR
jgi:enamine deaminase RidA (YjgF/YER057c/UK114 family)